MRIWGLHMALCGLLCTACTDSEPVQDASTEQTDATDDPVNVADGGPACVPGVTCPLCLDDGGCDCDPDKDDVDSILCGGDDCDDWDSDRFPKNPEKCDYVDNDCNGVVDDDGNKKNDDGTFRKNARHVEFYRDKDGDGWARARGENEPAGVPDETFCEETRPGYVQVDASKGWDSDDTQSSVYPDAPEICDGLDNDGDGETDEDEVLNNKELTNARVLCDQGRIALECVDEDWLWCPEDIPCVDGEDYCREKWHLGCSVHATKLDSCRACNTDCKFRCGHKPEGTPYGEGDGCDEIVQLAGGSYHTCGLSEQGVVACWGRGVRGQLGNGSGAPSDVPRPVYRLDGVVQIASGGDNTCAIVGDENAVHCWGDQTRGQLGVLDPISLGYSTVPLPVTAGHARALYPEGVPTPTYLQDVVSVAVESTHVCVVHAQGFVLCWGDAEHGRLGNGVLSGQLGEPQLAAYDGMSLEPATSDPAVKVVLGPQDDGGNNGAGGHGCMLSEAGKLYCWGDNSLGQLGIAPEVAPDSATMTLVPSLSDKVVEDVAAGVGFTCALAAGEVLCWGANNVGQLGREEDSNSASFEPAPVPGSAGATQLAVGSFHACALVDEETLCWGARNAGQRGALEGGLSPAELDWQLNEPISAVATLTQGTCIVTETKKVLCVGEDTFGQLGTGTNATALQKTRPHELSALAP